MTSDPAPPRVVTSLTSEEQLAFAGLARLLIRADGTFSEEEATALEDVALDLLAVTGPSDSPYRQKEPKEGEAEAVWALMDRAARELPDDESIRRAAQAVTRAEAREAIHAALFEIASSDVISREEWPVLDWLAAEWAVEASPEQTK